jgi:hypothetical protein
MADTITDALQNSLQGVVPGVGSANVTELNASSGDVANGAAVATLPAVAGKTNYVTGFEIVVTGATAAATVLATLTGLLGGTLSYPVVFPAGAGVAGVPLVVIFNRPLPASAVNTAITLTLPASGAGGLHAVVNLHGFVK